jgi:hypothetical protein
VRPSIKSSSENQVAKSLSPADGVTCGVTFRRAGAQQQLETIASNLAAVRSLVEQLTASQKQMALDRLYGDEQG